MEKGTSTSKKSNLLRKGLAIIEKLAILGHLSVGQLSKETQIPQSSVYRILCILEDLGYASRSKSESIHDMWNLDPIFLSLSAAILDRMELKTVLKDILSKLSDDTREIVQLAIFRNNKVLFVDNVRKYPSIVSVPQVGSSLNINSCVAGLVFGAFEEKSIIDSLLEKGELPKLTQYAITDPGELREKFARIRKDGYAIDDQYYAVGHRCVGAPVFDNSGKIIAEINVSGHMQTITDDRIESLAKTVMARANEASHRMGFGRKTIDGLDIIPNDEQAGNHSRGLLASGSFE